MVGSENDEEQDNSLDQAFPCDTRTELSPPVHWGPGEGGKGERERGVKSSEQEMTSTLRD